MGTYLSNVSERPCQTLLVSDVSKSYYQDEQRAKLEHLEAEIDSLLQQLQNLNKQRLGENEPEE
ncbi:hypothetical protein NWP17_17300 [Chrysosporum bergii ANA360D]|jgi:hypothetical protein|uniref:Uncharacterized protein n=1 Tax=Chrysosporum bergii ANA360D TaxID=617107 RepID=A0AA43GV41_9CYAN|nr:hypothetical protein [Chrysosporum bergii]MDH6062169.1 hypothetical protein [Chrysosporum bergii ANA360D]